MKITELYIYPIKGCRGTALTEAEVEPMGLRYDRRWMLVRLDDGQFFTQRQHPEMARIVPQITETGLQVTVGKGSPLFVPFTSDSERERRVVTVWRFTGEAEDEGEEAASWFSEVMGFPCRLVCTPQDFARRVNPQYGRPDDPVSFADGYPLLVTSHRSLDDLNARIVERGGDPIPMNRFRPNVVLSGVATPWEEDNWQEIRAESVVLRRGQTSARCAVTTLDQTSGEKMGGEPLATLAQFRRDLDGKVYFGLNVIPERTGLLRVGEPIEVVSL